MGTVITGATALLITGRYKEARNDRTTLDEILGIISFFLFVLTVAAVVVSCVVIFQRKEPERKGQGGEWIPMFKRKIILP